MDNRILLKQALGRQLLSVKDQLESCMMIYRLLFDEDIDEEKLEELQEKIKKPKTFQGGN